MAAAALTRRTALALAGAALAAPAVARASASLESVSGRAFGTAWQIVGREGAGLSRLRGAVEALLAGIDREMSPWRADSAVSAFNAAPAGGHAVSAELARVAHTALDLAARSDGAFDPTIGPLVKRWGFGPISGAGPDWRGLSLDGGTLAKARDGLTFDPCGIAKGRALDRMAALCAGAGAGPLLMDLGGELRALGRHPSGRTWRVAVEAPSGVPAPVLALAPGSAVATSGLAAQSYGRGGRRYGHIIDASTGTPATGGLFSVTVLTDSAMAADGWATALFAAGATGGPDLARTAGLSALFLTSGPGSRQIRTGAIAEHLT